MKPAVAVTLIIGGVITVALPPLADAWRTLMTAWLMEHGATYVNIEGNMPDAYRFGCWLLAAAMIGIATLASLKPSSRSVPLRLTPVAE